VRQENKQLVIENRALQKATNEATKEAKEATKVATKVAKVVAKAEKDQLRAMNGSLVCKVLKVKANAKEAVENVKGPWLCVCVCVCVCVSIQSILSLLITVGITSFDMSNHM
jgi:hypothetical protein